MAVRGEYSISVVNDGKDGQSAYTFWRYSDDNGKTMTKAATSPIPNVANGDNQFTYDQLYHHNGAGSSVSLFTEGERGELVLGTSVGYHVTAGGGNGGVFFYQDAAHRLLFGKTGTPLVLSCYMRAVGGAASVSVGIEGRASSQFYPLTADWQRFEVRAKSDDQGHALLFYAYKACKFDICCIQFAQGQGVDTWQPAPKDAAIGTTAGKYLGVASWDKPYPPMNSTLYQWTKVEGKDAELYKLHALEETAVVDDKGVCKVVLIYEVHHVIGDFSEKYTGNDVTINTDSRVGKLNFTKKATGEWECVTTIADFVKKNLGSFNVSVQKGAQVLDTRVIPVTYATQVLLEANQKLGEVVASVRSVSKLIHNLFVGSTFLEPIEGVWSMVGAKVDDTLKYNNSNVVFIEEHGATQDTYHSLLFNVSGLAPNTAYTISAMVCTDNLASFTGGNNGAVLEVIQTTNGKRKRLFDPISIVPSTMNTWEKVEHTFTTPSTLTSEVVEVKFMLLRNGRLWLSQPMMNQGNMAADYTANIKDIQLSLAQIKVTANTISQSVTDLSTGLESVGIHLNGAEKKITLHGDTEMVDANGKRVAMFKDGKIITEAIDADKVVTEGIQSKTIDAKNATFENVNIKGDLTVGRLRYKANAIKNNKLDCSFIYGSENLTMPVLNYNEFMRITVLVPIVTRVVTYAQLTVGRNTDCFLYEDESLLDQGRKNISLSGFIELIGIGVSSAKTIWIIKREKNKI
ncbi:hypothetical protein [Segatella maculosa]|uniref:hypothetical protein n=1 Tax=Segatella maculosa TaxID=439703 RepID=UPI0028D02DDB|nr:hypothetical protein [Segatella maculosa]